jgi:hypothetical protein
LLGTSPPRDAEDVAGAATHAQPTKGRKAAIAVVFVLAIITLFGAVTATWIKRQVLDNHHWTTTSAQMLQNKEIQTALGAYLVNSLFTSVDVAGEIQSILPPQGQALAAPAAAALRQLADRAAPAVLERPRVQDAWRKSNEVAHQQLLNILNGGGKTVGTKNGEVDLNLHSLVDQLAKQVGLESQVAAARQKLNVAVPNNTGNLVILKSSQLKAAQDYAKALKSISVILTVVSLGLFALAVVLARGARRVVFRTVGWSFVGLGVACLIARRLGGDAVVNGLVQAESVKPAAHAAWDISTSLLRTMSLTLVVFGLFAVLAAWLAGGTSLAVASRHALAPSLRERTGTVYGVVTTVFLLLVLWGPTPAFHNWIPVILMGALLVLGIEILRRQTAREFPDARVGDGGLAMRDWWNTSVRHKDGRPESAVLVGHD